jgi:hypothetical protein
MTAHRNCTDLGRRKMLDGCAANNPGCGIVRREDPASRRSARGPVTAPSSIALIHRAIKKLRGVSELRAWGI